MRLIDSFAIYTIFCRGTIKFFLQSCSFTIVKCLWSRLPHIGSLSVHKVKTRCICGSSPCLLNWRDFFYLEGRIANLEFAAHLRLHLCVCVSRCYSKTTYLFKSTFLCVCLCVCACNEYRDYSCTWSLRRDGRTDRQTDVHNVSLGFAPLFQS